MGAGLSGKGPAAPGAGGRERAFACRASLQRARWRWLGFVFIWKLSTGGEGVLGAVSDSICGSVRKGTSQRQREISVA